MIEKPLQEILGDGGNTVVSGIANDSRQVTPGDLFLAYTGEVHDGHAHVQEAVDRGAVAVCLERPVDVAVPSFIFPHLKVHQGAIAARFYGDPSAALECVGVTGTNGKTSIGYFCAALLDEAAFIGTIGWGKLGHLREMALTTENPVTVQGRLHELRELGFRHIAMETSSHALHQGRVADVCFNTAVFSNLTRDHLDYHGTMERYAAAKLKLFEMPSVSTAVINMDDPFGRHIAMAVDVETIGYGTSADAAVSWSDIEYESDGIQGCWHTPWGSSRFRIPLFGDFSIGNAAAALSVACLTGKPLDDVVTAMQNLPMVPGRMQMIPSVGGLRVVIDYAHTPDALEAALKALRMHFQGRLTCVFGCGGDRDQGKRALMAKAAESGADSVVVTSDNPRNEDPEAIIADIAKAFYRCDEVLIEVDRETAVTRAIEQADEGDVVLIAGKGHESYQEILGERIDYSDFEVASRALSPEVI
jgi:UDP-N-acetylmuramoyl-L-alanyl-D-glutamate--2,6-diaminopimelate ligase